MGKGKQNVWKERCGSLNRYSPLRLMCFKAWPIGSDTIRRCCLVGGNVALLDEIFHAVGGL